MDFSVCKNMNISQCPPKTEDCRNSFVNPGYMTLYKWEGETFDQIGWQTWFLSNRNVCFYIVAVYLGAITLGRLLMKNREPFRLKRLLVLWNILLSVFSTVVFVRTVPELLHLMKKEDGFHESVCIRDGMSIGVVFWGMIFTLSKVIELGDTLFIVLRKQPLIVLHWYHHTSVLCFTWYFYADVDAAIRWCMTINAFVHAVMYSYYAIRALGIKVPKRSAMLVTICQLLQMFFGVGINVYAVYAHYAGNGCQTEPKNAIVTILLYASYAVLFSNFFNKAYFLKKRKSD